MHLLREPDPPTACAWLAEQFAAIREGTNGSGPLLQLVGTCEISYQGRARSHLAAGKRVILVKPDGTVLVHTATGAKPANWQPAGSSLDVALAGQEKEPRVVVTARRVKQEESLEMRFSAIDLLVATRLTDPASLSLVGTEDDLQALLFARPELVEPGFVPARRERDTTQGYYDIDGRDAKGRRLIVELKRGTAGVSDAQQLWRYVEALRGEAGKQGGREAGAPDGREAGAEGGAKAGQADADATDAPSRGKRTTVAGAQPKQGTRDAARANQVRGMLVAPSVAPKARALLASHDLEWRELDWDELLPRVEAMRHAGQASLMRF